MLWEGKPGTYVIFFFPPNQPFPQPQVTVKVLEGAEAPKPPPDTDPIDPPPPNQKVTAVTYVYEKDDNAVPEGVATALQRINTETPEITATEFDQDTVKS